VSLAGLSRGARDELLHATGFTKGPASKLAAAHLAEYLGEEL
jgi:hypothetical protein